MSKVVCVCSGFDIPGIQINEDSGLCHFRDICPPYRKERASDQIEEL
jgi:hypothetical protein